MKWVEKSLDELGTVSRGRSRHRPRDAAHLYGGPFPFVQTGDVKHAGLYLTKYGQTYSDAGLAQSKLWPAGTLCITIAANIADTAILGMDACFPDSVIGFIADKNKADPRFVKYLFDALLKKRYQTFSQGVAQDNLSQEKLLSLKLTLPENASDQKRAADVLSVYDEFVANNEQRIDLLERSARLLFEEWFLRFRYPGHEHDKITDGIPEGWQRTCLGEATTNFDSKRRPLSVMERENRPGPYPYHGAAGILDRIDGYSTQWESGKSMFVAIDKITAVRMHDLVRKKWAERIAILEKELPTVADEQDLIFRQRQLAWMHETLMAVVISEEQGEVDKFRKWHLDIIPHRKLMKEGYLGADGKRIDVDDAFKSETHPFRIVFVCAMWLTGFDVPSLGTLYLDKPMKAHTLMQAIARANRVNEGKTNGLIVDYCGILKSLRKALATFAGTRDDGTEGGLDPTRPNDELLEDLKEAIAAARRFLTDRGVSLDAIIQSAGFERNAALVGIKEAINTNDETRKRFEILAREVFSKFKSCLTLKGVNDCRSDHSALGLIYKSLQKDREAADISGIMQQLHQVVDAAIVPRGEEAAATGKLFDISAIDFDRLRAEFERSPAKRTTVINLMDAVEKRLARMMAENPTRTNFQARYEEMVTEYNEEKDRVTIEATFQALLKFVADLGEEESRAVREGLDPEALTLFDLLKKPDLKKAEIERLKAVAASLLDTLEARKKEIQDWRAKEATRDAIRQEIYDFLYDDETGLPEVYSDDEIAQKSQIVFAHVFSDVSSPA